MNVSPAITRVGGYDLNVTAEDTDTDEDEALCRICRSPEEAGNPLRYPCLCRGSIKYVHQNCLRLWLDRRGYKKCEVCGRSYSIVPVYAKNAPERLPCSEFLMGVLLKVARFVNLIVPWILVFLFNAYCHSLHSWGQELAARLQIQSDLWMSRKFASLCVSLVYSSLILSFMATVTLVRMEVEDFIVRRFPDGNGLLQGVIGGAINVLWKYMKILSDWYHLKLISLGQPPGLIHIPPNAPLHEFGVIRRLLFFLDDNAFAFLAISVYVPLLFVLLPFSIGWIVLTTVGGSYLSGNSPVILGYKMMLSVSFAYFGIPFTLRHFPFTAIVRWFSLGFHFIAVRLPCLLWVCSLEACKILSASIYAIVLCFTIDVLPWLIGCWLEFCNSPLVGFHFLTVKLPCLLWSFSVKACKTLSYIKDPAVLFLKIGVLPCIIGWWLEICTFSMFRTAISQRSETLLFSPSMIAIRWISGSCWLIIANSVREHTQEIIHKRVFWYLLDVTDPEYKITKLNLRHTFFVLAYHGVLLVILTHLPIQAITRISPSFFPLDLWLTNEKPSYFESVVYFDLLKSGAGMLVNHIIPAMKPIIHNWTIIVSSWLQLSDFMLVVPRGEGFDQNVRPIMQPRRLYTRWFRFCSTVEGSLVIMHGSQNTEDDVKDHRDNRLLLRISLMLVLAALSLFLISTAFMTLPLLAGRLFFDSISFIMRRFRVKHDDLCALWIGCSILQAIYISTCFAFDHLWRGRTDLLLKYISISMRIGLFFSIWISVIPGLLGLLIDLMIIIPSRVPLNESPVYFLTQDWLIGVVVLHIWTFLTMFTPVSCFATKTWQRKFERIRNEGINRLPSMWVLRDVIGSIITTLVSTLCIPYLLVKTLFPLLGFPQSINSVAERFIWPVVLALITLWFMAKLTRDVVVYLHQLVFNERYLVGERVGNLTEDLEYD